MGKKTSQESHNRKLAGLPEETPNTQDGRAVCAGSSRMGSSASEPGETQVSVPRAIQEQEAVVAGSESLKGRGRTSPVDRKQTRRKDPWHRPCIPFRLPDKEVSMGEGYRTSRAIETRSPACCLQTGLPLLDHCSPACQQGRKPGLGVGGSRVMKPPALPHSGRAHGGGGQRTPSQRPSRA